MKRDGVAVEICLTSNDGILGVSGDRHPFNLYRKVGIPINLNTDDEGINRSMLTMEFVRAVRSYNLIYADVKELARNSIQYSFLPGDSLYIERNYRRLRSEFAGINKPGWKPTPNAQKLMDASEKMRVQVRLEQAFAAFENGPEP
jgi:adenosine deaminase